MNLVELHKATGEEGSELPFLMEDIENYQFDFNTSVEEAVALNMIAGTKGQLELYKALVGHYKQRASVKQTIQ